MSLIKNVIIIIRCKWYILQLNYYRYLVTNDRFRLIIKNITFKKVYYEGKYITKSKILWENIKFLILIIITLKRILLFSIIQWFAVYSIIHYFFYKSNLEIHFIYTFKIYHFTFLLILYFMFMYLIYSSIGYQYVTFWDVLALLLFIFLISAMFNDFLENPLLSLLLKNKFIRFGN